MSSARNASEIDEARRRRLRIQPLWLRVERNRVKLALTVVGFLLFAGVSAVLAVVVPIALLVWLLWARISFTTLWPEEDGAFSLVTWWGGNMWLVVALVALAGMIVAGVYLAYVLTRPLRRQLEGVGAAFVPLGELPDIKSALKDMAIAAGVDFAPELWSVDSGSVNAFVVAKPGKRPACVVTRGFIQLLGTDEQRAVFANLMARLIAGDIMWATVVSALMAPVWRWRDADLQRDNNDWVAAEESGARWVSSNTGRGEGAFLLTWAFFAYVLAVVASELVMLGHRRSQVMASEAADAEGMLLLKDERVMLRTLERVIEMDNRVRLALPLYSQLFYIWAGDGPADEGDPERVRLDRLREIVGIEGRIAAAVAERGVR